jgi:hypothetical protein
VSAGWSWRRRRRASRAFASSPPSLPRAGRQERERRARARWEKTARARRARARRLRRLAPRGLGRAAAEERGEGAGGRKNRESRWGGPARARAHGHSPRNGGKTHLSVIATRAAAWGSRVLWGWPLVRGGRRGDAERGGMKRGKEWSCCALVGARARCAETNSRVVWGGKRSGLVRLFGVWLGGEERGGTLMGALLSPPDPPPPFPRFALNKKRSSFCNTPSI